MQVSSVSNFCPDTGGKGGHLFRLTFSGVLWGGRNTANRYHWCMWGVLAEYGPHWVCPSSWQWRVLSLSTLLRLQVAVQGNCPKRALGGVHFPGLSRSGSQVLHKGTDPIGHAFFAFPKSEQLRRPGAWWVHSPRCALHLITSLIQLLGFLSEQRERHLRCAICLLVDVNRPKSQERLVTNWEPAHSLVEDAVSGTQIASCLPALAVARLPLCLWSGEGRIRSWLVLLWHSLSPLFCEWAKLCLKAFCRKMLSLFLFFFSLSGYPTVWVAISH